MESAGGPFQSNASCLWKISVSPEISAENTITGFGKPQKKFFFSGPANKREAGGKGPATKEKGTAAKKKFSF